MASLAILTALFIPFAYTIIWENPETDLSPPARRSHAMAYDPENDVVVLFGGFGIGTHLNDTWVYDPKKSLWINMQPAASPSPRAGMNLVYDETHKNFILFGGFGKGHELVFDDTWSYDYKTNTWKELRPKDQPTARASYGTAYDSKRDLMAMFGGFIESNYFNELWLYDPETNSWEQRTQPVKPPARGSPGFVYDEKNDVFVLFGGFSEEEDRYYNDTWIYDPKTNTWKEVNPSITPPPIRTRMVFDESHGRAIFFGGNIVEPVFIGEEYTPEPYSKTWVYEVHTNEWEELDTVNDPPPKALNGIAYDSKRNSLIIFGGTDTLIDERNFLGREFSDIWILPLGGITLDPAPKVLLPVIIVTVVATGGMAYFVKEFKKK